MTERMLEARSGRCRILLGEGLEHLSRLVEGRRALLVTDAHVREALGARFPDGPCVQVGVGEGAKTLATVEALYEAFLEHELDRGCLVVGVGGGIVCDLVGFAASTYQRGLAFGFVPTTLLAQVDASIGGKNGVNLRGTKNLVGLVRQPAFVLVDPETLATLPPRELAYGMAELVKAAAVADGGLFARLEAEGERVMALEPGPLAACVAAAVEVKRRIVQEDEAEAGPRMLLNFGHTLGHALEKASGGAWSHGEAVAIGMVAAARASVALGHLPASEAHRLEALLERLGLPTAAAPEETARALKALRLDKKRRGGVVHAVLLEGLGRGIRVPLELDVLARLLAGGRP